MQHSGVFCTSVPDPHHFDEDPDPACHFDADPGPTFLFDAARIRMDGSRKNIFL
jgi:hypothetical protein